MTVFKKVAVALSGGVNSAVSAVLLKNKGFDVVGAFIKCYNKDLITINEDFNKAEVVCRKLKIPLIEINLAKECWATVFENIIANANVGYSVNPDILFNEHILFGCFHQYCLHELNVDAVATGHCVKSSFGPFLENYNENQSSRLLRSADGETDHTNILSRTTQKAMKKTMFPIGELTKIMIEKIAFDNDLRFQENFGTCFMDSKSFNSFLTRYVLEKPGEFVDMDTWKVIGEHNGIHKWKIGQQCLNKYYVVDNDENSMIFVVSRKDHPALYCRTLNLNYSHWLVEKPEELLRNKMFHSTFQYTNDKKLLDCLVVDLLDFPEGAFALLESKHPMYAVSKGQFVAFYQGRECLGSMKIMSPGPSDMILKDEILLDQQLPI